MHHQETQRMCTQTLLARQKYYFNDEFWSLTQGLKKNNPKTEIKFTDEDVVKLKKYNTPKK